jgi:hypothetical protein
LRETLEEGYVDTASSLEVFQQLRIELDMSEEEHRTTLTELGIEDRALLDPSRLRTKENLVRLNGYRKALKRVMFLQHPQSGFDLGEVDGNAIKELKKEYSITTQEEAEILGNFDPQTGSVRRAGYLLEQLAIQIDRYRAFHQAILNQDRLVLRVLKNTVHNKKRLMVTSLLEILVQLGESLPSRNIAENLNILSPVVLTEILENLDSEWRDLLDAKVLEILERPSSTSLGCSLQIDIPTIIGHLEAQIYDRDPLACAVSLYAVNHLEPTWAKKLTRAFLAANNPELIKQVVNRIINFERVLTLADFPYLEKLVYLFNSDFFLGVRSETLIALGDRAYIKTYQAEELVMEEGEGQIQMKGARVKELLPGQILDELEVLSHQKQAGTIIAKVSPTPLLAIPVDSCDEILAQDGDFARRVLEMESCRLQSLLS